MASGPGIPQPARKVHTVLELLEREEDQDRRGLQTRPGWHPALEHEQRAFVLERVTNYGNRRLIVSLVQNDA